MARSPPGALRDLADRDGAKQLPVDQDQPLPGRGPRALSQVGRPQRGRRALRRAAAAALLLLRRRGRRRRGRRAARAPAGLRPLPGNAAGLPGGAEGCGSLRPVPPSPPQPLGTRPGGDLGPGESRLRRWRRGCVPGCGRRRGERWGRCLRQGGGGLHRHRRGRCGLCGRRPGPGAARPRWRSSEAGNRATPGCCSGTHSAPTPEVDYEPAQPEPQPTPDPKPKSKRQRDIRQPVETEPAPSEPAPVESAPVESAPVAEPVAEPAPVESGGGSPAGEFGP